MTAVIDYGAGNLTSVLLALKFLGDDPVITDDPVFLEQADRIIFPGVGSAASGMEGLKRKRLDEALKKMLYAKQADPCNLSWYADVVGVQRRR